MELKRIAEILKQNEVSIEPLENVFSNMESFGQEILIYVCQINENSYRFSILNFNDVKKEINYIDSLLIKKPTHLFNDEKLLDDFKNNVKEAIEVVSNPSYWYNAIIDINDFPKEEIEKNLSRKFSKEEINKLSKEEYIKESCKAIFEFKILYSNKFLLSELFEELKSNNNI